ncbi:MAG: MarR family transcriptional regulator [Methanotrichaceae archaeon]
MIGNGIRALDDRDRLFIYTLRALGVHRQEATLVVWLSGAGEVSSKDIEQGTGIRQSDVSKVLKAMEENGWISILATNSSARGSPRKIYSLRASLDEIIGHYEQKKLSESALAMGSIERLKELAN